MEFHSAKTGINSWYTLQHRWVSEQLRPGKVPDKVQDKWKRLRKWTRKLFGSDGYIILIIVMVGWTCKNIKCYNLNIHCLSYTNYSLKTSLKTILWPVIPATWQEDHQFKADLNNLVWPHLKIKFRKHWWCTSVAEHLPNICEALALIPIVAKQTKHILYHSTKSKQRIEKNSKRLCWWKSVPTSTMWDSRKE